MGVPVVTGTPEAWLVNATSRTFTAPSDASAFLLPFASNVQPATTTPPLVSTYGGTDLNTDNVNTTASKTAGIFDLDSDGDFASRVDDVFRNNWRRDSRYYYTLGMFLAGGDIHRADYANAHNSIWGYITPSTVNGNGQDCLAVVAVELGDSGDASDISFYTNNGRTYTTIHSATHGTGIDAFAVATIPVLADDGDVLLRARTEWPATNNSVAISLYYTTTPAAGGGAGGLKYRANRMRRRYYKL